MSFDGGERGRSEQVPGKRTAVSGTAEPNRVPTPGKQVLTPTTAGLGDMGRAFGRSFDDVQLHTGPEAHAEATAMGARAFTRGNHVYFADGAFDPSTTEGKRVIAHELTHVVQQRGATPGAPTTQVGARGDKFEQEAQRGADAVLAGQQPVVQEAAAEPVAMRFEEPAGIGFEAYLKKYATQIIPEAMGILETTEIAPQYLFASWKTGSSATLVTEIAQRITAHSVGIIAELPLLCAPGNLRAAVNRGRGADENGGSPDAYFKAVASEVANLLIARVTESVKRLLPRYAHATNTVFSQQKGPVKPDPHDPPDPTFDLIVMSAPIDKYVAPHLLGKVRVDLVHYRDAHPNEKPVQKPRVVEYTFAANKASSQSEGRLNFVEITSKLDPPVTAEDVALTLFGTSLLASTLTPVPPLWGFRHPDKLLRYEDWKKLPGNTGATDPSNVLGYDESKTDPAKALLASGDADKAALAQGGNAPGTGKGTKTLVALRMRAMMVVVDGIGADLLPTGVNVGAVTAMGKRLDDRSQKVLEEKELASGAQSLWDGQSAAQRDLLGQCASGAKVIGANYKALLASAGDTVPKHLRDPVTHVAAAFADAAAVSDLVETGAERLVLARKALQLYPIDLAEGILSYVRQLLRGAFASGSTTKGAVSAQTGKTDATLAVKEMELRARCAALRTTVETDPAAAMIELQKIQEELKELQHFATIMALIAQSSDLSTLLDELSRSFAAKKNWGALNPLAKEAKSKEERYRDAQFDLLQIKDLLFDTVVKPAKENKLQASYDALPAVQKAYQAKFKSVSALIDSEEAKEKWLKIGLTIGIGVATGGLAEAVVAIGTEAALAPGAMMALKVGTETTAFTAMTQSVLETDPSIKSVTLAFFQNLGTFALVSKAMAGYQAALPGFAGTGPGQVVGAVGMFIPHCAGTVAAAEARKYLETGKHLDDHELRHAVEEGVLVTIGTLIGDRVTRKFLHGFNPHLPHVKKAIADIDVQREATKAKAKDLAAGGKHSDDAMKVIEGDAKTLKAEEEVLKSKEITDAIAGSGPHTAEEKLIVADEKGKLKAALDRAKLLHMSAGLRSLGGDNFVADGAELFDLVKSKHLDAGHPMTISRDPVTNARVAVVKTAGENPQTIRIIEDTSGSQAVTAKPEASLPRTPGEQKGIYEASVIRRLETEYQTKKLALFGRMKHQGGDDYILDETTLNLPEVVQRMRDLGWRTAEIVEGKQVKTADGKDHKLRTARFEAKPDVYREKPPFEADVRVLHVREEKPPTPTDATTPEQWARAKEALLSGQVPNVLDLPQTPGNLEATVKLEKLARDGWANGSVEGKNLYQMFWAELGATLKTHGEPIEDLNLWMIEKVIKPKDLPGDSKYLFQGPRITKSEVNSMGVIVRGVDFEGMLANKMVTQDYYRDTILPRARAEGLTVPDNIADVTFPQAVSMKHLVAASPPTRDSLNPSAPIGRPADTHWWASSQDVGVPKKPAGTIDAGDYAAKVAAQNLKDGGMLFTLDAAQLSDGVADMHGVRRFAHRPTVFDALWNVQFGPYGMGGENWGKTTPDPASPATPAREVVLPPVPVSQAKVVISLTKGL